MDHKSSKAADVSRRGFMQLVGLGAGTASAVAVGVTPSTATAASASANAEKPSAGYRETEHVKAYYALARI